MKKIILLTVFSVLLFSIMIVPSLSQEWTVGVNVGDWFMYEGTLVLWEADASVPFPPNEYALILQEYNVTDWYKYTVTDIVGSNVTFDVLVHWSNGTETTSILVDNMTSSFSMMVIGANLEPGIQIRDEFDWEPVIGFPLFWPARTLNETIMVEYESGPREMNVLDWTHPPTFGYTRQMYHWDKEYGIQAYYQVESTATDFASGGEYTYIAKFQLVDSSMDVLVIPEYLPGAVMLLVLISITVSIGLYRRKRLHT